MKYVENKSVVKYPNGVYHLTFNCTQRELYFHRYNNNLFLICGTVEEYDDGNKDCEVVVPDFLPKEKGLMYSVSSLHDKNVISFFFIPFSREILKNREIIL